MTLGFDRGPDFRQQLRSGFMAGMRKPSMNTVILGVTGDRGPDARYKGIPIYLSHLAEVGKPLIRRAELGGVRWITMHPDLWEAMRRPKGWSKYSAGVIEARRDRRRR